MDKPAKVIRVGSFTASIWPQSLDGTTLYNTVFQRGYKKADGSWGNSQSIGLEGLGVVSILCTLAAAWIAAEMRRASEAPEPKPAPEATKDDSKHQHVDDSPPAAPPTPDPAARGTGGSPRRKPRGKLIPQDCGDPTG